MNGLKIRKFCLTIITYSLCIGFGFFTVFDQFRQPETPAVEYASEENTESDVKSSEKLIDLYISEPSSVITFDFNPRLIKKLGTDKFALPAFCACPNTPPPDSN